MSSKTRNARKSRIRRQNRIQDQTSPHRRLRWMVSDRRAIPFLTEDRLPSHASEPADPPDDRAEQIVADRLYEATPLARLASRRKSQQRILRRYDESARELEELRTSTEGFLKRVLTRGFDFEGFEERGHLRSQAGVALRGMLEEFLSFHFSRPASIKSLGLLAQPGEGLYAALDGHLRAAFLTFVRELEGCLNRMSHRKLLGSVKYSGRRAENCEFTYFRAKAVCETESQSSRVTESRSTYPTKRNGEWWKNNIQIVELLTKGVITIQHVWHTHLLSGVKRTPVDAWRLPLPERIDAVVRVMPGFLRPYASIVTGELEFARIIARDLEYVPWEYRQTHEVVEEVRHYDPALLLGPWVLTGWCHQEQPNASRGQQIRAWLSHGRVRGLK